MATLVRLVLLAACITLATPAQLGKDAALLVLMNECRQKSGATAADLKSLQEKKLPSTHSGQCLLECVFTNGHLMTNGKFSKEGLIAAATPSMKGDAGKIKQLKDMADQCDKELAKSSADHCELSKEIVECTMKNGKSFGFKFPTRMN